MASINGISIKSLNTFKDHEGMDIYQGNVYYKGKKLGFWSQDSWGGEDTICFDKKILAEEVERYRKSYLVEDMYRAIVDLNCLLESIVHLMQDEKLYKKGAREGRATLILASDGFHLVGYSTKDSKEAVLVSSFYKKFIADCKKQFFDSWDGTTTIYESLDDFNIEI